MEKLTIQQVCLKSDKLKKEIIKRLKCQIIDFEVVQHESEISIHWYAYYPDNPHIEIPYGWMISTIDWSEKWLHMYASHRDIL